MSKCNFLSWRKCVLRRHFVSHSGTSKPAVDSQAINSNSGALCVRLGIMWREIAFHLVILIGRTEFHIQMAKVIIGENVIGLLKGKIRS